MQDNLQVNSNESNTYLDKIDLEQKAKELGFWILPPTIDEFLSYTNLEETLYPFWRDKLREIYTDNLSVKENYIMLTGAIGTGKSTMSKVAALYTVLKLLCLKDLKAFRIAITKPIQFVFFHVKMEKARDEFVNYLEDFINTNDYFREIIKYREKIRKKNNFSFIPFSFVTDGVKSNNAIGGDVIFYVFSEANFVNEDMIMYKIDQAYKRFKSRFILAMPYLGNIIIDTSSNYEGSVSDILADKNEFYIVRASQWQVKPFAYFKKGHFYVYLGDAETGPFIIYDDEEAKKYPEEKIIKVPKELEKEFKSDLYDALLSLAGINIRAPNTIFNLELVNDVMVLNNPFGDIINVFELYKVSHFLSSFLPREKVYYIHIDTSIRGDYTGIAIAYWETDDTISIPLCIGVHNNKSDIPMYVIEEFIGKLSQNLYIDYVSADNYQSYKLLQDIERKYNIKTKVISIDSTPAIYLTFKKAIVDKKVKISKNNQLLNELVTLKLEQTPSGKAKIDHPIHGSKDIADATACAFFMCAEENKKNRIGYKKDSLSESDKYFQEKISKIKLQFMFGKSYGAADMIKNIFKK